MKWLMLGVLVLCRMASAQEVTPDTPYNPPPQPAPRSIKVVRVAPDAAAPALKPSSSQSLYVEGAFQSLTGDRRNYRVGDLITVLIYENASATSSADTAAARVASVSANLVRPAGSRGVSVGTSNDFTGSGRTQRAGRILAQLTVTVQDIAPNRDLVVGGEQLLEINGEKQVIRLEGLVRPQDIGESNTLMSTKIADARITFLGDGVVGDRQKPSWWHQLLHWLGL